MNNLSIKRILALFVGCLLALALCAQGLAEQMTVYTASDDAKVYNAKGGVIGALPANTELTVTAVKGDVCRVEKGGKTAYMLKADLKQAAAEPATEAADVETPSAQAVTAYVAVEGAKVYASGGKVAGTLSLNAEVIVTAVKGNACQVTLNGQTGYMRKSDLSANEVEKAETAAAAEVKCATAYVSVDSAQMIDRAGDVIATLSLNTEVSVAAVKGSVCQVTADGKTGYMLASTLSCDKTEKQATVTETKGSAGYVGVDKAKVYDAKGNEIGALALNAAVSVLPYNDNLVMVATGATKGYMRKADISDTPVASNNKNYTNGANNSNGPVGSSTIAPAKGTAQEMDWWTSGIQKIFARGTVAQITDVATGLSWQEKRTGGINHADCQPLTAADTAALKNAYGGVWSWDRHAVFVTIDGVNYAASINGMPHGGDSIPDNDFAGHHCIHFTNSRLHVNDKVDSQHQKAIKKAAATTLE